MKHQVRLKIDLSGNRWKYTKKVFKFSSVSFSLSLNWLVNGPIWEATTHCWSPLVGGSTTSLLSGGNVLGGLWASVFINSSNVWENLPKFKADNTFSFKVFSKLFCKNDLNDLWSLYDRKYTSCDKNTVWNLHRVQLW